MGTQGPELQEERRYKVTYHTYLASNCRTHQALSVPYPSEGSSSDEGGVHSESKSKSGASGSFGGEDISDFNSEKAQGIFDDWVISLPLQS